MDDKQKDEYIAQLESIIAMMPGNVYWKDKDGKYLGCNDNILKIFKLGTRSDLIGKTLTEIMDKNLATPLLAVDQEVLDTGKEKYLEEIGPDLDGNLAVYLTKKAPLRNSSDEIIGLVGVSFDISERKKIEDELKQAHEQLETINKEKTKFIDGMSYLENVLAVIPGNVYWKDITGKYLGCNDNMAKILNLKSRYDIRGQTLYTLAPTKELASTIEKYDEYIMLTNQEKTIEEFAHDANGQPATYLTRKVPLHNEEGKVIGMLGISIDITERKKLEDNLIEAKERAEAANKAKSEFLAMVSHELRIPLTGMLGMAQLLSNDDTLSKIHYEAANDIIKSGDHLLALVDDLLDISKLEANKMQLNPAAMDLKKLIEDVVSILLSNAKQKNLELQIHYENNTPHLVYSDARALRQILLNLIGNAIKFTKVGHIFIKITCLEQSSSKAKLMLIIEDTGIGIPTDKLESIFERFNQADTSITRQYGGTGLGLAICKSYIELMGGNIKVESEIGKGSTFKCTIPFRLQQTSIATSPWEQYKTKVKILIVDDTLRGEVISKHIASSLCQVVPGSHAFNTLLAAQPTEAFNIIIIDEQLISVDYMELAIKIKKFLSKMPPLTILFTSENSYHLEQTAKAAGFFTILSTQAQPTELLLQLTAAWEQWSEQSMENNNIQQPSENKTNKPYVLLVEDEPIVAKVHQLMLQQLGCKVEVAATGQAAISKANANVFDIIFMDIGLPDISGYEVTQTIRQSQESKNTQTVIIGLTGYAHEEYKVKCIEAGMNHITVKPIKMNDLQNLLIANRTKK